MLYYSNSTHTDACMHAHVHMHTRMYVNSYAHIHMHTHTHPYLRHIHTDDINGCVHRYKAKLKHQEKVTAQLEQDHATASVR